MNKINATITPKIVGVLVYNNKELVKNYNYNYK